MLAKHPRNGLALKIHSDLGQMYQISWQTELASMHLQKALELAPAGFSFPGDRTPRRLDAESLFRIQLSHAVNLVIIGSNDVARTELSRIAKNLQGLLKRPGMDPRFQYYLAECEVQLAELDLRDRDTLGTILRLRHCLKTVSALAPTFRSLELQFTCHLALAYPFRKLARFEDADAHLNKARILLPDITAREEQEAGDDLFSSKPSIRHHIELENAKARFTRTGPVPSLKETSKDRVLAVA